MKTLFAVVAAAAVIAAPLAAGAQPRSWSQRNPGGPRPAPPQAGGLQPNGGGSGWARGPGDGARAPDAGRSGEARPDRAWRGGDRFRGRGYRNPWDGFALGLSLAYPWTWDPWAYGYYGYFAPSWGFWGPAYWYGPVPDARSYDSPFDRDYGSSYGRSPAPGANATACGQWVWNEGRGQYDWNPGTCPPPSTGAAPAP